jgi:hypothetical protein
VAKVGAEIKKLGSLPPNPRNDSGDFQEVKKIMLSLPEPAKRDKTTSNGKAPAPPSTRTVDLSAAGIRLRHPDNWKPTVQGNHATLAPDNGVINGNLAYGVIIDTFQPQSARNLSEATTQLLDQLKKDNPAIQTVRSRVQTRVDGQSALLAELSNDSPVGGKETDFVVTILRSNTDLLYFIMVVPSKELDQYRTPFNQVLDSVRLR